MAERKAFDTTTYCIESSFVNDLASLAIESSTDLPYEKRVNPFVLETTDDGNVINRVLGTMDILGFYSDATELDRAEKEAGEKIRECLLTEPNGTLSIWISPPGGPLEYEEGRIVVGINKDSESGVKFLESYGICIDFQAQTCLEISNGLNKYSTTGHFFTIAEDLRSEIFIITPPEGKPWKFLREQIPMDDVWDSIEDGQALQMKHRAMADAQEISQETLRLISLARTEQDYIQAGAYAERYMNEKGWNITSGACGTLNKDLVVNSASFFQTHIQVGIGGNVVGVKAEMGKFVKKCGKCGKDIYKVIKAGYRCTCGGTYEGC